MMAASDAPSSRNSPAGQPTVQPRRGLLRRVVGGAYRIVRGVCALAGLAVLLWVVTPLPEAVYRWLDVSVQSVDQPADYIVCLGGDHARLIWTVDAYRRGMGRRIIVTNLPGAAQWMGDKLVQCGIQRDHVLIDETSGTTGDHPAGVARLPGADITRDRFLLVTNPNHSRRARACFLRAGYQQVEVYGAAFPPRWKSGYIKRMRWRLMSMPELLYECAGLAKYTWQGKI